MSEYDATADVSLKAFTESGILGTGLLNKFSAALPSAVSVTSLTFSSSKLDMACEVPSRKVAAELILALKNSGLFLDVQVSTISNSGAAVAGYTLNISTILKAGVVK